MNRILSPRLILPFLLPVLLLSSGCTTLQNRRDLYFPQCVWGPYTRMLHKGIPKPTPVQGTATSQRSGSGKNVIKPRG